MWLSGFFEVFGFWEEKKVLAYTTLQKKLWLILLVRTGLNE
jgi:hypothetical protein